MMLALAAAALSTCSPGFYSYIPKNIETETAFSVEVQPTAVEVLFIDFSNMFARKRVQRDGTVVFQESSGPEYRLRCNGAKALVTFPDNGPTYRLVRTRTDIWGIAKARGWQTGD